MYVFTVHSIQCVEVISFSLIACWISLLLLNTPVS